jgi:predicted house-cleaning noncanonical NTP pyrophosphatase (MazG superfamily)
MKYDKLVRDKIPENLQKIGKKVKFHKAGEQEYWEKLKTKLKEEADEFYKDSNKEEFADILEVMNAIKNYKGFDEKEIEDIRKKKAEEKGAFIDKIILEEVED